MRQMVVGLALAGALALMAGCGGDGPADGAGGAAGGGGNEAAEPTPLTAQFAQPTTIISITASTDVTETTGTTETTATVATAETPEPVAVAAEDLERGGNLFATKGCSGCHGAQGEGVPDRGSALAGTQLSEAEFEDILRTGGKGELGNDHIYGPSAFSPGGIGVMYAWVKSLPAE